MAEILRVKAKWVGFSGAPGYSVFHFRDFETTGHTLAQAQSAADRVKSFYSTFSILLPTGVGITVDPDVEVLNDTDGKLQNVFSVTAPTAVSGAASAAATYASAVGAVVTWRTGGVLRGRRVRGRTFLVPLSSTAFQNDGTLATSTMGTIGGAAATLRDATGSPDLGVYARPSSKGATDGAWFAATSHSVPDMGAVLRSRRD